MTRLCVIIIERGEMRDCEAERSQLIRGGQMAFPKSASSGLLSPSAEFIPNPVVLQKTPTGERIMDIWSRLLQDRIIFLGTPIDSDVANLVMAQMLYLEGEDPDKDIMLYINSPGGEIDGLMCIYDTMEYIKSDVSTICMGLAASAAAVLLAAGAHGKRMALPNSRIVIHQPHGGAQGQAVDIEIQAREIMRMRKTVNNLLSERTGQPFEKVVQDTDRDFIMVGSEAKDYGMVDVILSPRDAVNADDDTAPAKS